MKLSHTAFVKVELFSATHSFDSSCYSFRAGGVSLCVTPASMCHKKDNLQKAAGFGSVNVFPPTSDYRAKVQCRGASAQAGKRVSMDMGLAVNLISSLSFRIPSADSIVLINNITLANNHSLV